MTTSTALMTAEELLKLPRGVYRYELIEGELIQMSPAGQRHGKHAIRIAAPLAVYVEDNDLGEVFAAETGFLLKRNPDLVRAPDAAFVRKERVDEVGDVDGYFPGAPDLAIEVVSPNDTAFEVEEKVEMWLRFGALAVWVLNSKVRAVTVHRSGNKVTRLTEGDMLEGEDVVPGFSIAVAKLFK
ncbi:MAG: Uma2 family endonuclease [Pyrinomonadaceae bacterium MAG19_C2-C3]|nr:Uma2 family endonuclease [Pyrinomonadaceae bacterium MAG19_C2-C3]